MVLDTHTHAWGQPSETHCWNNGPLVENYVNQFSTDIVYSNNRLLADMDDTGIEEAVVVGYPITDWTDNWYTLKAAQQNERLYGVGMLDPFADKADNELRELMSADGMLGFRMGVACPYNKMWKQFDYNASWLSDSIKEEAFWDAALETNALVQMLAHRTQLDQVRELVRSNPDLPYLFDHFMHVDADDHPEESFSALEPLAEFDRVAVKISEIAYISNEEFPFEDAHDHVRWLIDTFGRERVVWGSDFPNVSHPDFGAMTYEETLSWLHDVPFLSERDLTWLTERSFREFIGL